MSDLMNVQSAAVRLNTTPKQLRVRLRSLGMQKTGKNWELPVETWDSLPATAPKKVGRAEKVANPLAELLARVAEVALTETGLNLSTISDDDRKERTAAVVTEVRRIAANTLRTPTPDKAVDLARQALLLAVLSGATADDLLGVAG
jgi:hypothetical protein